jgi:hypothetical protein
LHISAQDDLAVGDFQEILKLAHQLLGFLRKSSEERESEAIFAMATGATYIRYRGSNNCEMLA